MTVVVADDVTVVAVFDVAVDETVLVTEVVIDVVAVDEIVVVTVDVAVVVNVVVGDVDPLHLCSCTGCFVVSSSRSIPCAQGACFPFNWTSTISASAIESAHISFNATFVACVNPCTILMRGLDSPSSSGFMYA